MDILKHKAFVSEEHDEAFSFDPYRTPHNFLEQPSA